MILGCDTATPVMARVTALQGDHLAVPRRQLMV